MPGEGILGENLEKTPSTLHQKAAMVKCLKKLKLYNRLSVFRGDRYILFKMKTISLFLNRMIKIRVESADGIKVLLIIQLLY